MRSILAGEHTVGTKILAGMPHRMAAYATAAPWLPPEAATTPTSGISRSSKLENAPRVLNDPACWRCSSLTVSGNDERAKSLPSATSTGVTRMWGLMTSYTLSIAGRSMGATAPPLAGCPVAPISTPITVSMASVNLHDKFYFHAYSKRHLCYSEGPANERP